MRAHYNVACIKFRKDNELHNVAWEYLNGVKHGGMSYSDCIAELVEEKLKREKDTQEDENVIAKELRSIVNEMTRNICIHIDNSLSTCSIQSTSLHAVEPDELHDKHEEAIDDNLLNFVKGMSDFGM